MRNYRYTAFNDVGKTIHGKMTAQNEQDLEERISLQGATIIDFKELKQKKVGGGKVSTKDLIMFCVHLEQLEKAGVPILDALIDIRDSGDSPVFRNIISSVYEDIRGGTSMSIAMAKFPKAFDEVFCGLIAAGEKTGDMAKIYHHLAAHLRWSDELRRKVKKALTYPIVMIIVMGAVVSMMMLFVVPQLLDFLTSQGIELPWFTRWLIATSHFFSDFWYLIFSFPIITIIIIKTLYRRSQSARKRFDIIILKLPAIGQVVKKINLARFAHFFAVTFSSGISVLECLATAEKVVNNVVMQEVISDMAVNVSEGSSITRAIAASDFFPNLVVRMFKVGEDSGNMEAALENINFFYDREVEDSVNSMIAVLQPTLTVVMGVIMFWVIAAIFGPLYKNLANMAG